MRFPVMALLAILVGGFAGLAPQRERNDALRKHIFSQQEELISLEDRNQRRRLLLQKLQTDPQFADRLSSHPSPLQGEQLVLPEALSIQIDSLLHEENPPSSSGNSQASAPLTADTSLLQSLQKWVAQHQDYRQACYGMSGLLLILGSISWRRSTYRRYGRKLQRLTLKVFSRYRLHHSHASVSAPHWPCSSPQSPDRPVETGLEEMPANETEL